MKPTIDLTDHADVAGPQPKAPTRPNDVEFVYNYGVPLAEPLPLLYYQAMNTWGRIGNVMTAISHLEWRLNMLLRDVRIAEDRRMRQDAIDKLSKFVNEPESNRELQAFIAAGKAFDKGEAPDTTI